MRVSMPELALRMFTRFPRFTDLIKAPEIDRFLFDHDAGKPLLAIGAPINTFHPARIVHGHTGIGSVQSFGGSAKIGPAVIELVSVDVVSDETAGRLVDYAMHEQYLRPAASTRRPAFRIAKVITPLPLVQPVVVRVIHKCLLALREWNSSHTSSVRHYRSNNTLLVSTNPVFLSRFSARLDTEHVTALQQQAARLTKGQK